MMLYCLYYFFLYTYTGCPKSVARQAFYIFLCRAKIHSTSIIHFISNVALELTTNDAIEHIDK